MLFVERLGGWGSWRWLKVLPFIHGFVGHEVMGVCGGRLADISGGLEGIHSVEGTWNSASEGVTPSMKGIPLRWSLLKAKAVWSSDMRACAAGCYYGSGEGLYAVCSGVPPGLAKGLSG